MKFDCIVMNPPYQRNLHLKILAEAIKHLKDEKSLCVNLSPDNWLMKHNVNNPIGKYKKTFNGLVNEIDVIDHSRMNAMFGTGNSIEEGCIVVCTKSKTSRGIDLEKYGFASDAERTLYTKVSKFKDGIMSIHRALGSGGIAVYGKSSKLHSVGIYGWHGGNNCYEAVVADSEEKPYISIEFSTEVEKQNFIASLHTMFMNWYYRAYIVPGNYIIKNHFFLLADAVNPRTKLKGYTGEWTDDDFYKYFEIDENEKKAIEAAIAKS